MSMQWKAVWAVLLVLTLANTARAVTVQDFYNDAVISTEAAQEKDAKKAHEEAQKVRAAGLVMSLRTEEFRSAQAGLTKIAECINQQFFERKF
jgi:hypothetical protein